MDHLPDVQAQVGVTFRHRLHFERDTLDPINPTLATCFAGDPQQDGDRPTRVLTFIDSGLARCRPDLPDQLRRYMGAHARACELVGPIHTIPGGERCKNQRDVLFRVLQAIEAAGLDRRSVVLAIGGGAVLDCVGFAAAIAHRGIRLVRMPTTTLAQCDSGVGVKNGVNAFGQKNYLGTFAVPWAVVNDEAMLDALSDRDWRCGFSEVLKVALVKDASLFERLSRDVGAVAARDSGAALPLLRESALLHLRHIVDGGDAFELTRARPLDFGHWAAHRLETLSHYDLRHGEAVAIGIAIDVTYASRVGLLDESVAEAAKETLRALGITLHHRAMADADALLKGLEQFRAHLGGELTITLPTAAGEAVDVHEIDLAVMHRAIAELEAAAARPVVLQKESA